MSILNINIKYEFDNTIKSMDFESNNLIVKQFDKKYSQFLEKKKILDDRIIVNTNGMSIENINKIKEKIRNNKNSLLDK